ncbi:MAG TPA: anti-sigma factor, partial [Miltoncostaeaceae bacterium]|nr:anti-sigma factor [Miltoncostaeaceae bacterium]
PAGTRERPEGVRAPRRRRWSLSLPAPALALGAAALLAVGVALGTLVGGDGADAPAVERQVELAALATEREPPRGSARILAGGALDLDVSGLAPTGSEDFYSVWLLGREGELVPLGSFQVGGDGAASLRLPLPEDPSRFAYVDVSREPADGDPGHSGDSVLRGATT